MSDDVAHLRIRGRDATRAVDLFSFLDTGAAEAAETEANHWIKSLRDARIDGVPLRDRFLYRDDSLWWFAELYLHKRRVLRTILRTVAALDHLIERERPAGLTILSGDDVARRVVPVAAARRGVRCGGGGTGTISRMMARGDLAARNWFYAASAAADRVRPGSRAPGTEGRVDAVAFVHSAFWRGDAASGDEAYIGPVLRAVAERLPPGGLQLVGVGPRSNYRVRRWRHRFADFGDPLARGIRPTPVEAYASWNAIRPSVALWARRAAIERSLVASADLREAAVVRGCDTWPLVRAELTGISHLQFPWSARAMDEAGAALDALDPAVVVTYAEAGGWGRALVLEARRRGISSVGLQHGFIYRHWLNYQHEADEMRPSASHPSDRGFPRPDLTLVYDRFAADHLVSAGSFPPSTVAIVGSPRLDAFVETAKRLSSFDRERLRTSLGAQPGQHLVVVAAKYAQIATAFTALARAASALEDVRLVVKCHPAETDAPYRDAALGITDIAIAPAEADLAALISAARLVVTVNSTAAIEAMAVDVPALVVALPNNLSPFVEAGAMAGVETSEAIGPALASLLYDEDRRARLGEGRRAFMTRYSIRPDGGAAARAADAIATLAARR